MNTSNEYNVVMPHGGITAIPSELNYEKDVYLQLENKGKQPEYFVENGYVVFRNLIPKDLCDRANKFFEKEVKTYDGYIYRQASANPEKHKLTVNGYMQNCILNIQDLNSRYFPDFKQYGLKILTHNAMQTALKSLSGKQPKMVQSMFFEGNPETWAHQDTYYLDSEHIGDMIGAWIATEDIKPGAGRFYVYPRSHRIDVGENGGDFDIAFNHDLYKKLIINIINKFDLDIVAPALNKGDVLFWSSKTIHGSLATSQQEYSRRSFTGHYIPVRDQFLQWQSRINPLYLKEINGMLVHYPKNQRWQGWGVQVRLRQNLITLGQR